MAVQHAKQHNQAHIDLSEWRTNAIKLGLLLIVFICAGVVAIRVTNADTSSVAIEAESGSKDGMIGAGDTADASGGASVKFGAGGSSCALPNYPNETCTGVPTGVTLTPFTGEVRILEPNTVIDGQDIKACVSVFAPGTVIKNSRITCPGGDLVFVSSANGMTGDLTIQDSELVCNANNSFGITGANIKAQRLDISGCLSSIAASGSFTAEDNYIHDVSASAGAIGIKLSNTDATGHIVKHNTIHMNSGLNAIKLLGDIPNTQIADNLIAGGMHTLSCAAGGPGTNISIVNNHFSTKYFPTVGSTAPGQFCDEETTVTGNVYHETGQPVPLTALR